MAAVPPPNTVTNRELGQDFQLNTKQLEKLFPILKNLIKDKFQDDNPILHVSIFVQENPVSHQAYISQIAMRKADKKTEINQIITPFRTHISEKFVNPASSLDREVIQFNTDKDLNIRVLLKPSENHTLDSIISTLKTAPPSRACYKSTPDAPANMCNLS